MRRRNVIPVLVLMLLSPVIGELLSGSAPPAEFFNPLGFVMLVILYGGGAVLAREYVHRCGGAIAGLLVVGAAYGIAEEALMCKSFFDPQWMDVGLLGSYGRWLGVNWVWSLELTIFHAVFSIVIPVVLAGIIFPEQSRQAWLGRAGSAVLGVLWVLNGIVIFLAISAYRPPVLQYGVAAAVVIGLCVAGGLLSRRGRGAVRAGRAARPFLLLLTGFGGTVVLFLLVWVVPGTGVHALATIGLMAGLAGLVWVLIVRMAGAGFSDRHRLSLISGALGFFVLLGPLQEMDSKRADNTAGMSIVAVGVAVLLLWIRRRVRARLKERSWMELD